MPVASLLITGFFWGFLDLFRGLKIGVSSGCLGETQINDVIILVKARIYMAVYSIL